MKEGKNLHYIFYSLEGIHLKFLNFRHQWALQGHRLAIYASVARPVKRSHSPKSLMKNKIKNNCQWQLISVLFFKLNIATLIYSFFLLFFLVKCKMRRNNALINSSKGNKKPKIQNQRESSLYCRFILVRVTPFFSIQVLVWCLYSNMQPTNMHE